MTDIIVSRRSVQLKCLGLYIAAFLMLVMLGQLWITGVRAHNQSDCTFRGVPESGA